MSGATARERLPMQGGFIPGSAGGPLPRATDWLRRNLFSSVANSILTIVVVLLAALIAPPLFR
ncbi:MAG: hypothetical protein ACHQIO_19885, partial [Nevskiales bacterium]